MGVLTELKVPTSPLRSTGPRIADFIAILIPLVFLLWQLPSRGFWHDEWFTVYYATHQAEALAVEPHSPALYYYISIFVSLFGTRSYWLSLASIVPSVIALGLLYDVGKRLSGRWMGFALVLALSLNPVFLQFARSFRGNSFLYVIPIIMTWILVTPMRARIRACLFFLTSLLGGLLHFGNVPAGWIVLLVFGSTGSGGLARSARNVKERENLAQFFVLNASANALVLASILGKFLLYQSKKIPESFHLEPSLSALGRWCNNYFSYAHESYSLKGRSVDFFGYAIDSLSYLYSYTFVFFIGLAVIFVFAYRNGAPEAFRIQRLLLGVGLLYGVCVWVFAFFGLPVLLPRSHLLCFGLVQVALGIGMGAITPPRIRALVLAGFSALSVFNLCVIGFYSNSSQEVRALELAEKLSADSTLLICDYQKKAEMLLTRKFVGDCESKSLERLLTLNQVVMPVEYPLGKSWRNALKEFRENGFSVEKIKMGYSRIYVFRKRKVF